MDQINPAISVIVPIYNSIKYIDKCIESILSQKFENYELLIINDGSTDGSGDICNVYELKDERIKVYHKSNGGVSSARNTGILNAKAEFLTFIDSDDWIDPDYLNSLYYKNSDCDLTVSGYKLYKDNNITEIGTNEGTCFEYLKMADFISENDILPTLFNPWRKLFRGNIIRNSHLFFDEKASLGEDTIFVFSYLSHVRSIKIISDIGYNYRFGVGLCHSYFPKEMYVYTLNRILILIQELKNNGLITDWYSIDIEKYFKMYFGSQMLRATYNIDLEKSNRGANLSYLSENFEPWNPLVETIFKIRTKSDMLADFACLVLNKIGKLR